MMMKTFLFATLLVTAWALPQDPEYDNYEYEESVEEEETVHYDDSPPQFLVEPQRLKAREGETIVIPCQHEAEGLGDDGVPTKEYTRSQYVLIIKKGETTKEKEILIFVDNVKVRRDRRYKLNGNQLEISNLKRSDTGIYFCRLESNPPVEINHFLEVEYAPKVTAIVREKLVHKGDSVKLECQAKGNPVPTIKWSKQNGPLPSGVLEEEGYSITLADVDRHVEGNYVCTADNGIGRPASDVISVIVEYPPEILTEKDIIHTSDGDTVELVCIVHGRPIPKIEWTKDGGRHSLVSHVEVQHNGRHRHSIKITHITEEDFGDYSCTAENKFGVVESIVSFSGMPKPPHFTSSPHGGEETTYTLTWDTESYYPITEYRVRYRKAKANDSVDEEGEWTEMTYEVNGDLQTNGLVHSMMHTLKDLEAATDYRATVQIKNQYMWGDNSEFFFSTRKELAQQTKISGASVASVSGILLNLIAVSLLRTL